MSQLTPIKNAAIISTSLEAESELLFCGSEIDLEKCAKLLAATVLAGSSGEAVISRSICQAAGIKDGDQLRSLRMLERYFRKDE